MVFDGTDGNLQALEALFAAASRHPVGARMTCTGDVVTDFAVCVALLRRSARRWSPATTRSGSARWRTIAASPPVARATGLAPPGSPMPTALRA